MQRDNLQGCLQELLTFPERFIGMSFALVRHHRFSLSRRKLLVAVACLSSCFSTGCAGVAGKKELTQTNSLRRNATYFQSQQTTKREAVMAQSPDLSLASSQQLNSMRQNASNPQFHEPSSRVKVTAHKVTDVSAKYGSPMSPSDKSTSEEEVRLVEGSSDELGSATVESIPNDNSASVSTESEPRDQRREPDPAAYTLNLQNVLQLADSQNPNVAFARERINEAYARVDRADVLWVPSLRTGVNFNHHEGNVQNVAGGIQDVSKSSWYGGLGAFGVGSNSPVIPGLVAQFQLTDAIFQPRIARHQAASREAAAAVTRNDILRNTSVAYLELVRAEHSLAITLEAFDNTEKLVKVTEQFAKTGQGLRSDYERMLAEVANRRSEVISRQENVRVSSARLAQLLHANPEVPIVSGEPAIVPLELMDHSLSASSYVATGLQRRPELAEQNQLVSEAVERLNREKYAPLVPSVLLGMSYGAMGGGTGGSLGSTAGRLDTDAVAFWEIRNFGFGEMAARKEMSSVIEQARQRQLATLDQVAREVVETHTQVVERERRIAVARQGIEAAERSYKLNLERIENIQGLPIESLQAVQALLNARQTYLNAVIDYNIAQIEFIRATGWFEAQ